VGKYDHLRDYLAARAAGIGEVTMTFDEVEARVGPLPRSAHVHRQWWADDSRVQARAWTAAGWSVSSVDQAAKWVTFIRGTLDDSQTAQSAAETGTEEAASPAATVPIYPFDEPGCEIVVHEGEIEIVGVGTGIGAVSVTMNGSIDIEWKVELPTGIELGDVTLHLQRPDLGSVELDAAASQSDAGSDLPALSRVDNSPALSCIGLIFRGFFRRKVCTRRTGHGLGAGMRRERDGVWP
jgi:hypothetical protein